MVAVLVLDLPVWFLGHRILLTSRPLRQFSQCPPSPPPVTLLPLPARDARPPRTSCDDTRIRVPGPPFLTSRLLTALFRDPARQRVPSEPAPAAPPAPQTALRWGGQCGARWPFIPGDGATHPPMPPPQPHLVPALGSPDCCVLSCCRPAPRFCASLSRGETARCSQGWSG